MIKLWLDELTSESFKKIFILKFASIQVIPVQKNKVLCNREISLLREWV